jgi:hypothetical protein
VMVAIEVTLLHLRCDCGPNGHLCVALICAQAAYDEKYESSEDGQNSKSPNRTGPFWCLRIDRGGGHEPLSTESEGIMETMGSEEYKESRERCAGQTQGLPGRREQASEGAR